MRGALGRARNPDETLMSSAFFSTPRGELRVIGSDLTEVVTIGAMLHAEFGYTALIHTAQPLARAASEEADLTVVLLKEVCTLDQASAAIDKSGAIIFVSDAPAERAADLKAAGAFVLRPDQTSLLQATVASLAAQVVSVRSEP